MFRAYSDKTMSVFYQPRKKKGEKDLSRMDREWTEDESIMARFEELTKMFGLVVVSRKSKVERDARDNEETI